MEAIDWEKIASSKLFKFFVGPERREFMVHSAIVARQSRVLNTLVNGNFSEAPEGHATLESVDEQTFVSFIQYAYTGDYSEKWPQRPDTPGEATSMRSQPNTASISCTCSQRQQEPSLWKTFKSTVNKRQSIFHPRPNTDAKQDYTDVFISHARLYIFADCYQISDLMCLTLSKLGQTLVLFKLYTRRVKDVVKLLEYCFGNPAPDELRSMLAVYTACKIEKMSKNESFKQLLMAENELSARLVEELIHRLR
ncbi:Rho-related BTB domain-containing protein 3 [Madurella mycetomatis]|uniref:Rho-related BTB domain-containing protein 3 n=1 Tax=Madurella mycetomatis TaxID=100816 RepID=A0A175WDG4_9PEZI|nr:Rho-related BTB domain-containing protein 3 [Madurella mycetomatis]